MRGDKVTEAANSLVWYLARGEQQWGPITDVEMGRLVALGKVLPNDFVWNAMMTGWVAAHTIPGMVRAPMPPPQPPPRPASSPAPGPAQSFAQPDYQYQPHASYQPQHHGGAQQFAASVAQAASYSEPSQHQHVAYNASSAAVAPKPAEGDASTTLAMVSYILAFIPGLALVGFILAIVNMSSKPDWLATHYRWQVRTILIGLLFSLIGAVLLFVAVGGFVLLATVVWFIVRYVKGISALNRREAVENVERWGF